MSQYNPTEMFEFLASTPEKGLRQLLVDGKVFTEAHFSMVMKIVRQGTSETFSEHYVKSDFPKLKFSPNETKIKETFWATLTKVMADKGLIQPSTSKAA